MLAVAAGIGWFWAFSLLATRHHLIQTYDVVLTEPWGWSFFLLPSWKLLLFLCAAVALAAGCIHPPHSGSRACLRPAYWLLTAYAIPMLELARLAGATIGATFLEPLWLSFVTGIAVASMVRSPSWTGGLARISERRTWLVVVWLLSVVAAVWWYLQGQRAYDDFMLGYHDFGHFARRVVSTWEGRGFLIETPSRPAFWDHFNPGLALLAPLWGAWPDARLFILVQAVCLVAPAPLVFGIARAWGAGAFAAAAWAAAYLAFPAVGQLNLAFSYGWHPVSLALPLIFAAVWLLLRSHRVWAAGTAVLACSFKETVLVTLACFGAALAFQAWWTRRRDDASQESARADGLLASRLPVWGWATVWVAITVAFVLIFKLTAFSEFQTNRFSNLGDSAVEILLSPVTRPSVFWGQILQPESTWFVLALVVPLGLTTVVRGWPILLAVLLPIGVLLAWEHQGSTCIAFQYITTLVPVFVVAAIAGAARSRANDPEPGSSDDDARTPDAFLVAGLSGLAASLTASTFLGALPWSSPTLTNVTAFSYETEDPDPRHNPRAMGSEGHTALNEIVAMVGGKDSAVLASGRVAAHLLGVRRLETVKEATEFRWDALCAEAGEGRSGVEVFDWIVLDTCEQFQQSADNMQFLIQEAERAGFRTECFTHRVLVLRHPKRTLHLP
ncbi:MAG: DUF2079 domain-containing protein [Planctomycetes bacterium]|nr:DUF2079 domain-containing protein [Planctomycetota bacterium]MBL7041880.1 DUF2079 domain-containing protein [Pirellulaceae bacterium]